MYSEKKKSDKTQLSEHQKKFKSVNRKKKNETTEAPNDSVHLPFLKVFNK